MTLEDLCKQTNLITGDFIQHRQYWITCGWYHTDFNMGESLVWEIPCDNVLSNYAIVFKEKNKLKILTDITFMGETRPIVQGHYTCFNYNNPKLVELIEHAKTLIDQYSIYDKRNKVEKSLEKISEDFR